MAKDFLTDDEMANAEGSANEPDFLSDEQMDATLKDPGFFEKGGQFEAGAMGAAQGITFGYSDEMIARFRSSFGDRTYQEELDAYRKELDFAKEKSPGTYLTGDVAGSIIAPIPGSSLRAASTAGKVGLGAAKGAAIGGLEASGRTENDLLSVEGLKDVAVGIGAGGVVGGALAGVGPLVKKGTDKFKKEAAEILDPSVIREGAMRKSPTDKLRELKDPTVVVKNKEAIAVGEKFGVFLDDAAPTAITDKTVKALNEVGEQLGNTTKRFTEELGEQAALTKGPIKLKATSAMEDMLTEVQGKVKKGAIDTKDGKAATKIIKEEFNRLKVMIDDSDNSLAAVRELKTNIYKRMDSADFKLGGTKAGTAKDTLKSVTSKLQDLEQNALEANVKILKAKGKGDLAKTLAEAHKTNLKDFGSLKTLEKQISETAAKTPGKKFFGMKDLVAAGTGGLAGGPAAAIGAFSAEKLNSLRSTPVGKFWLAKSIEWSKKQKAPGFLQEAAKNLGVTVEFLKKYIAQEDLIKAGAAIGDQ